MSSRAAPLDSVAHRAPPQARRVGNLALSIRAGNGTRDIAVDTNVRSFVRTRERTS
ncbi:MAG: hypothetical protein MUE69_32280 [Myxococcota bacterium]|jgi:hypothetical protein|nr:hypothetical protein [Myxococcota bacterium]